MKLKSVLYYIEFLLMRAVTIFAGLIPLPLTYWLAKRTGDLFYWVIPKRRNIALENLSTIYHKSMSLKQKQEIVHKSFQNAALSIVELFTIPKMLKSASEKFRMKGVEHLEAAFKKGKGAIWVVSHLGSWEYLAFLPYLKKYSCSVVVKPLKNPFVNQELDRFRNMTELHPIEKMNAAKEVMREIKKNHLVSILIDQWAGREGIETTFFGIPTSTTSIPVRIAKRTGCALIPAYCIRSTGGFYDIEVMPEVPISESDDNWEFNTTQELNRLLEAEIRKYPEQWMWSHRRWKPMPSTYSDNMRQVTHSDKASGLG